MTGLTQPAVVKVGVVLKVHEPGNEAAVINTQPFLLSLENGNSQFKEMLTVSIPLTGCTNVTCNDDNPCTNDTCDPNTGACVYTPNDANVCDDGNACTLTDSCVNGTCVGSGVSALCGCITTSDCTAQEDGNACNGTLVCLNNACVVDTATVVTCDASADTVCLKNTCASDTGVCQMKPTATGTACSDGNACTINDACTALGQCTGTAKACDDGEFCNGAETCDATTGGCIAGQPPLLNDSIPCTIDVCDEVNDTVLHTPDTTECSLPNGNACLDPVCDPSLGCTYTFNTAPCDDGNSCSPNDFCSSGVCVGQADPNICSCSSDPDCAAYEDGNLCNGTLQCVANGSNPFSCQVNSVTVVDCQDPPAGSCFDYVCNPGTGGCVKVWKNAGSSCDDGNLCTVNDSCSGNGQCLGTPVNCSDGKFCNGLETCDVTSGLCKAGNSIDVNDGIACTDDSCDEDNDIVKHVPRDDCVMTACSATA